MPVLDYDTMEAIRPYLVPVAFGVTLVLAGVLVRLKRKLRGGALDLALNVVVVALFLLFLAGIA